VSNADKREEKRAEKEWDGGRGQICIKEAEKKRMGL
jgi:hypothetical protein